MNGVGKILTQNFRGAAPLAFGQFPRDIYEQAKGNFN